MEVVDPVDDEEDDSEDEGEVGDGLVEVLGGEVAVCHGLFDDGDEVEDGGNGEGAHRRAVEDGAAAEQEVQYVYEAGGVENGGYAQPEEAHLLHCY